VEWSEAKLQDISDFEHFNAFFTRELAQDARPVDPDPMSFVSPCDGRISQCGRATDGRILQAKAKLGREAMHGVAIEVDGVSIVDRAPAVRLAGVYTHLAVADRDDEDGRRFTLDQMESLDEVVEGICIGQAWEDDVRVVLFVRLREGLTLDDALRDRIRSVIRKNASPRHVPARVVQVDDIPRTRSGKITELAVRDVVHGRAVKNVEALANPEALEHFRNRSELAS